MTGRPDRYVWAMNLAHTVAQRSTCSRRHVGAVAFRDGRVLGVGYNGAPAGLPHCDHSMEDRLSEKCQTAVHAEANLIATAARYGVELGGATIVCTDEPCAGCAGLIINAGIVKVLFQRSYRNPRGSEMLRQGGIEVGGLYP